MTALTGFVKGCRPDSPEWQRGYRKGQRSQLAIPTHVSIASAAPIKIAPACLGVDLIVPPISLTPNLRRSSA